MTLKRFFSPSVFGLSWIMILSFFCLGVLFVMCPEIDLWVSDAASDPETLFYLNHPLPVRVIYNSVEILTVSLSTALVILLIATRIKKHSIAGLSSKGLLFLLLALMLGPGLVVNVISKNIWGRARPAQIEQFGGSLKFSPAFVFSDQCDSNCAFVSGHSALGFYFVAFALLFKRHRKKLFAFAVGYGILIGFGRIYQGGHFISDVIFSFYFVYLPIKLLYYFMYEKSKI